MHRCIFWQGHKTTNGYGNFRWTTNPKDPKMLAHRAAWIFMRGPIPKGLMVLHKCDNRDCINPNHLFLGTQTDNMRDAAAKGRLPGPPRREKCRKGHKITESSGGYRYCHTCRKIYDHKRWIKKSPKTVPAYSAYGQATEPTESLKT